MSKIITHEEYINTVKDNNPYVDVIGIYNGMRNKIMCQCKICGEKYEAIAYDVKIGKKHQSCAAKISGESRLKDNKVFQSEIAKKLPHITLLEKYNGSHYKLLCRCELHHELFKSDPTHLLEGKTGCKQCKSDAISNALRKTHEDYVNQLSIINNKIDVLGNYIQSKAPIQVKCKICGFIWNPIAGSLLKGNGCPHCVGRHKTTEEFKTEIKEYNDLVDIIGEYVDSHTKIECRCKICGNSWFIVPNNLKVNGCPECNMSHGEREIKKYLQNNNIMFIPQKTFDGLKGVGSGYLSYDFYIPEKKLLIEYQGEFHDGTAYQQTESEYQIQKEHDIRKKEYAIKNGYKLLEIWYWDYPNIEKILERELC